VAEEGTMSTRVRMNHHVGSTTTIFVPESHANGSILADLGAKVGTARAF